MGFYTQRFQNKRFLITCHHRSRRFCQKPTSEKTRMHSTPARRLHPRRHGKPSTLATQSSSSRSSRKLRGTSPLIAPSPASRRRVSGARRTVFHDASSSLARVVLTRSRDAFPPGSARASGPTRPRDPSRRGIASLRRSRARARTGRTGISPSPSLQPSKSPRSPRRVANCTVRKGRKYPREIRGAAGANRPARRGVFVCFCFFSVFFSGERDRRAYSADSEPRD